MRRPKYNDCLDDNDEFDSECYEEAMGMYGDSKRDELIDEQIFKDEKDAGSTCKHKQESGHSNSTCCKDETKNKKC